MTDRDTFAAAALTGLLGGPGDKDFSADFWARHAYKAADAMLRERARTSPTPQPRTAVLSTGDVVCYHPNHDAVPAAKAYANGEPAPECGGEAGISPRDGTGNTTLDGAPAAEAGAGKPQISHPQAGNTQTAPPCVETDGPPSKGEGLHVPYSRTRDIVTRLRGWFKDVNAVPATDLMDEAADEIERLRIRSHEREAIAAAAESVKLDDDSNWTTLIELLERTK